jgi:hypothetical protein
MSPKGSSIHLATLCTDRTPFPSLRREVDHSLSGVVSNGMVFGLRFSSFGWVVSLRR